MIESTAVQIGDALRVVFIVPLSAEDSVPHSGSCQLLVTRATTWYVPSALKKMTRFRSEVIAMCYLLDRPT